MSGHSFFAAMFSGRPTNPRALHLWAGPLGLHLYWPLWTSRFEWMSNWKGVDA